MKIAIHPDKFKIQSYSDKWKQFLKERNVEVKDVNLWEHDSIEKVKDCDGVMWRWNQSEPDKAAIKILTSIEKYLKIPTFPSTNSTWHYDDKVSQKYVFAATDTPTPETWVFWHKEDALKWVEEASFPKVFKLSAGASSNNVILVKDKQQAISLIHEMFGNGLCSDQNLSGISSGHKKKPVNFRRLFSSIANVAKIEFEHSIDKYYQPLLFPKFALQRGYCYFQEFLPGNEYDTRITIIGNRAFCFRRFNRKDDFRASGSGNIDFDPGKIDRKMIKIGFEVSEKLGFECMAYDFIYKNKIPCIVEISYTFADWAVQKCPGHWDRNFNWIEGSMWPEEAQVIDFLKKIESHDLSK